MQDPSPFTSIKSGRFCLDSSKLEEIEALTGSPPLSNLVEVPVLSDISEISELSETQPIAPLPAEPLPQPQHSIDSVSDILNERTEKLLKNSSNISKRPRKKKASPMKIETEKKEKQKSPRVPGKAKYCTEEELLKEKARKRPTVRPAWQGPLDWEVAAAGAEADMTPDIGHNSNLLRGDNFVESSLSAEPAVVHGMVTACDDDDGVGSQSDLMSDKPFHASPLPPFTSSEGDGGAQQSPPGHRDGSTRHQEKLEIGSLEKRTIDDGAGHEGTHLSSLVMLRSRSEFAFRQFSKQLAGTNLSAKLNDVTIFQECLIMIRLSLCNLNFSVAICLAGR